MTRAPRALLIAAVVALAAILTSCGTSGGDAFSATTTSTSTTVARSGGQQAALDAMSKYYEGLGLEKKQADCLAGKLVDQFSRGGGGFDPSKLDMSKVMDAMNQCDVKASDLSALNPGGGIDSKAVHNALLNAFNQMGFDQKKSECLADAFVKQFGDDMTALQDMSAIQDLYSSCGIDLGGD
ncbi:hypothetical protein [Aquihabitans sp. McL0605]|uniref:hypothetical protein n=1 Tax=Aquihabitans sp. McL0605 TaxID=3415671 RepID=UPI003CE6CF4E